MKNKTSGLSLFRAAILIMVLLTASGCRLSFTELTQTAVAANPPTPFATPDPAFAAQRGQQIFVGVGQCSTCHSTDGSNFPLAPDLQGIASRHDEAYLRESIVDVKAAVPDGWRDDLMPADYGQRLSRQQIDDLVAFMLTLQ